jgi:hypothetical protein
MTDTTEDAGHTPLDTDALREPEWNDSCARCGRYYFYHYGKPKYCDFPEGGGDNTRQYLMPKQDALPPPIAEAPNTRPMRCYARMGDGVYCERPEGHAGPHHDSATMEVPGWERHAPYCEWAMDLERWVCHPACDQHPAYHAPPPPSAPPQQGLACPICHAGRLREQMRGHWSCSDCLFHLRESDERSAEQIVREIRDALAARGAPEGDDLREAVARALFTADAEEQERIAETKGAHTLGVSAWDEWPEMHTGYYERADAIDALYADRLASLEAERQAAMDTVHASGVLYGACLARAEAAEAERDAAVASLNVLMRDPTEARAERYAEALREIWNTEGHVCDEFETCAHVGCRSSYAAWQIADKTIRALAGEARTTKEESHGE